MRHVCGEQHWKGMADEPPEFEREIMGSAGDDVGRHRDGQ